MSESGLHGTVMYKLNASVCSTGSACQVIEQHLKPPPPSHVSDVKNCGSCVQPGLPGVQRSENEQGFGPLS